MIKEYFKAVTINEDLLDNLPIVNGRFIVTVDTKKIFIDLKNTRQLLSKFSVIFLDTEKDRKNLTNAEDDVFYLVKETKTLYIHDSSLLGEDAWINISGIINSKANDFEIDISRFTNCILFRSDRLYSPTVNETSVRLDNNESLGETLDTINNSLIKLKYSNVFLTDTPTININNFNFNAETNLILVYVNSALLNPSYYKVSVTSQTLADSTVVYTTTITSNKFIKNSQIEVFIL